MNSVELAIYCADIGSIKNHKFGWAVVHGERQQAGKEISELVDEVVESLAAGVKVALGFECLLWVPVPDDSWMLTAGRKVDGDKPWSAGAGAGALATRLTETAWILRDIRRRLKYREVSLPPAYLDWKDFTGANTGMLLWEAFVEGKAKAKVADAKVGTHAADALIACEEFATRLPNPAAESGYEPPHAVRSLIGAAMLWSGWAEDLGFLSARCLVVKPTRP